MLDFVPTFLTLMPGQLAMLFVLLVGLSQMGMPVPHFARKWFVLKLGLFLTK